MNANRPVSVVIPTFGRPTYLRATVERCLEQTQGPLEVVVVDQEGGGLAALAGAGLSDHPALVGLKLPAPNLHLARNTGIHHSRGEYVLMLDDDVTFERNLVEQHLAGHGAPDVAAVVGRIEEPGRAGYLRRPEEMAACYGVRASGRSRPNRGGWDHCSILGTPGANVSFRRDLLLQIGGYDLRYDAVNSFYDDLDVGVRLRRLGYRIAFRRDAWLFHHKAPGGGRQRRPSPVSTQASRIRNITLFYLKNMPPQGLPWFIATFALVAARHSLWHGAPARDFATLISAFAQGRRLLDRSFAGCGGCPASTGVPACRPDAQTGLIHCRAARQILGGRLTAPATFRAST